MSDELERQLEAFGATLESSAGEPIRASDHGRQGTDRSRNRAWAIAGAAACLLAVVVGLMVVAGRDAEAPAAQPPTATSTSIPLVAQTPIDPELLRTAPIAGLIDGCGPDEVLLTGNLAEIGGSLDAAFAIAYDSIIEHTPPEVEHLPLDEWTFMASEPVSVVFLDRGAGIEAIVRIRHDDVEWSVAEIAQCLPGRIPSAIQTTTIPPATTPQSEPVPDDPLGLERDGWTLTQLNTDPFEYEADALPVPCPRATVLEGFNGTPQVVDMLEHPTSPSVDVLVLDVGSAEAGAQLADAFLGIGDCAGDAVQSDVTTMAFSSIQATWFRAGSELAIATIVGAHERSVVLAFEDEGITDDLIGELAHRADQFLRGAPISGTDSTGGISATEGSSLGSPQVEPVPGQVKLWVGNQSFDDDPVAITVAIDDQVVVEDVFEVGGQHNWFSFMIDGLDPGEHTLTAISDTGVEFSATFTLPPDEPRWMVVDYWYYPDDELGRHFTFRESDEPIYFA